MNFSLATLAGVETKRHFNDVSFGKLKLEGKKREIERGGGH
jgi:hypothetical protein